MSIQELVYGWEEEANVPNRDLRTPGWPTEEERRRRLSFIEEEFEELLEAEREGSLTGVADALGDLVWVIYGTANAFGMNLDAILHEISDSNFSKLIDGAEYDENGKLIKSETFVEPDIQRVLDTQEPL